jgi:hypothetical protein
MFRVSLCLVLVSLLPTFGCPQRSLDGDDNASEGEGEDNDTGNDGEGEGPGEGEGEGDVGEGEGETPECTADDTCALGTICEGGACTPGCRSDRDCSDSQVCVDAACGVGCTTDADCVDGVCGENGTCTGCTTDDDCDLGTICESGACSAGCRVDRDCPDGLSCSNDACIEACASDADCALGTFCDNSRCTLGCNDDDARCGDGRVCTSNGTCAVACDNDACPGGSVCAQNACVTGCLVNDDCAGRDVCLIDGGATVGTCVRCIEEADCTDIGGIDFTCDTVAHECLAPCFNGFCGQGVCDEAANQCVECLDASTCAAGQACTNRVCTGAVDGEALCRDCEGDDAICGAGNLCVRRDLPLFQSETACAVDCSITDVCPRGYACEFILRDDIAVGKQCVLSTSRDVNTCVAIRDQRDATACSNDFQCGGQPLNDGVCAGGICTVACGSDNDCEANLVCAPSTDNGDALVCQ